ncbi:MAG: hypothetical protein ABI856_15000 [Nitrospira sp.]
MADPTMPPSFSVNCGNSPRLILARRHFIESYLRLHGFAHVRSEAESKEGFMFYMTVHGQNCRLQVSESWMVSSTHVRVEERLDQLQTLRILREQGGASVDITMTGEEVLGLLR